jgi:gluconokinase
VFLKGSYATIQQRMHQRKDHYMPAALLQSQFDALELPADAIEVAVEMTPEAIVSYIMDAIR